MDRKLLGCVVLQCQDKSVRCTRGCTPAEEDVPGEVFPQGEEGAAHQHKQEVTLHQQPAVVGEDGVVGKHQHNFARHLPHKFTRERKCKVRFSTGGGSKRIEGAIAKWFQPKTLITCTVLLNVSEFKKWNQEHLCVNERASCWKI